jgi:probable rRNA maturation factor
MTPEGEPRQRLTSRRHRSTALLVLPAQLAGRGTGSGLARWLVRIAPARARGTVSLAIVSDRRVRALNVQYRGLDYATDVLSFPDEGPPTLRQFKSAPKRAQRPPPSRPGTERFLGEIVIARGVARRQARQLGHSEEVELRVLALHGLLHLLGYDHEQDRGQMSRVEQRLRRKGGLPAGLIERTRGARRVTKAHGTVMLASVGVRRAQTRARQP